MSDIIEKLESLIKQRKGASPDSSYVASLFTKGRKKIAQKLGEEGTETVIAALAGDRAELVSEGADLLFHLLILLEDCDVSYADILSELERREGVSGIAEKAARKD